MLEIEIIGNKDAFNDALYFNDALEKVIDICLL